MSALFEGKDVKVREVKRRDGSIDYAICRPWAAGAILSFSDRKFANDVAEYIEGTGGGMNSEERRAAVAFAKRATEAPKCHICKAPKKKFALNDGGWHIWWDCEQHEGYPDDMPWPFDLGELADEAKMQAAGFEVC